MKIFRKFSDMRHGWRGVRAVWNEEWHFKYQVSFAALSLVLAYFLDATLFEWFLLLAFVSIALAAEIINTAIEDVCNRIQPEYDVKIGAIKDMAQAFVIVSSVPALSILLWILISFVNS